MLARPDRHPLSCCAPAGLMLVVGLAGSIAVGWELHREAVELDGARLALRIKVTTDELDGRLEKTELLLGQLQDFLRLSGDYRPQVFRDWCARRGLDFEFPWVHGIAVATNRHAGQWRRELIKPPSDWTRAEWGKLEQLALDHPADFQIALQSPVSMQRRFLADYDLKGSFRGGTQFATAVLAEHPRMSGRQAVMLDAESNALTGTVFFGPVYDSQVSDLYSSMKEKDPTRSMKLKQSARWLLLRGMIVVPIDFGILERRIWSDVPRDLGVEVFSSTNQNAGTWLNPSAGGPRAADPLFRAYLTRRVTWPMYGKRFSIFFYTTPLFEAQSPRRLAKITWLAGVGLTLLATALVGVGLRTRNQQRRMAGQIQEARDALIAAQQERTRIGQNLHDDSIQSLYAIQLGLDHAAMKLTTDPVGVQGLLAATRADLDKVIAGIRQFIVAEGGAERPTDVCQVLNAMVQRLRAGAIAQIELRCDPKAAQCLTGNQAVQLANIAHESLSNSLRHSKPKRLEITLLSEGSVLCLEVADDGIGFDPKTPSRRGFGIASMTARARELGGTLSLQSTPGQGTRVVVRVPTHSPPADGS